MTTKPKPRKAPAKAAAIVDPIFAAIAEHKALVQEFYLCQNNFQTARSQAEKKHGWSWTDNTKRSREGLELAAAETTPQYDLFNNASRAAFKAGMRMARTKPKTLAGVGALADYLWRNYSEGEIDECDEEWATIALKTVAATLAQMNKEAA
jgi:hypothetical protein